MQRYFVDKGNIGYIIRDTQRTLPLPFNYFSRQYADEACMKFNECGYVAVAEYYYVHRVAGNGYNVTYKDWMDKNKDMFK